MSVATDAAFAADLEEIARLRAENDAFRARTGNSKEPCLYCGLSAQDQLKCRSGFPGCARADDQMLCPHFAAELAVLDRAEAAEKRVAELEGEIASLEKERDVLRRQREQAFENASKWAVELGQMQGERDAATCAAFEKAAAILDMVAADEDDTLLGAEAADAFNGGATRRPMSDRLRDWNAALSKHFRALAKSED